VRWAFVELGHRKHQPSVPMDLDTHVLGCMFECERRLRQAVDMDHFHTIALLVVVMCDTALEYELVVELVLVEVVVVASAGIESLVVAQLAMRWSVEHMLRLVLGGESSMALVILDYLWKLRSSC